MARLDDARLAWIEALESEEYVQGHGALRAYGGTYCCLGVACDLSMRIEGEGEWYDSGEDDSLDFLGGRAFLPDQVQKWLGWEGNRGDLSNGDCLSGCNDGGDDFSRIAQRIEDGEVKLA